MSRRFVDLSWPIADENIKPRTSVDDPGLFRYNGYICISHELHCSAAIGVHFEIASHCVPDPNGPARERLLNDDVFAVDVPVDRLYEIPTTFIRLDRDGKDEQIRAADLEHALDAPLNPDDALLVQAQQTSCRGDMPDWQYMYFAPDAVDWIVGKKVRLFGSDVWEDHANTPPYTTQLFLKVWQMGAWCLVYPNNLASIRKSRLKLTVLPLPTRTTVTTCRAIAIEED